MMKPNTLVKLSDRSHLVYLMFAVLLSCCFSCEETEVVKPEFSDDDFKSVVYIDDLFSSSNPSDSLVKAIIEEANTVAASDFNVLLINFLHVDTLDHLNLGYKAWFNGPQQATAPVYDQLPAIFANIKEGRASVDSSGIIIAGASYPDAPKKIILLSLGGALNSQDMLRVYAPDNGNVYAAIQTVISTYHIDGIDLDYEPAPPYDSSCAYVLAQAAAGNPHNKLGVDTTGFAALPAHEMLAGLIQNLRSQSGAKYISAAPYEALSWWTSVGPANFDWWNVQFYAGQFADCPDQWVAKFQEWQAAAPNQPSTFIVPGINTNANCGSGNPDSLAASLENLVDSNIQAGGAFIWNYTQIENDDPANWAKVIASHSGEE